MRFDKDWYQLELRNGRLRPPTDLCPYIDIDRRKFQIQRQNNPVDLEDTFEQLKARTTKQHYNFVYPPQTRALRYSVDAFPSYEFVLPEVLAQDWLATVDWHKFQRDHVVHQPLTASVVLHLLSDNRSRGLVLPDGELLINKCVQQTLASPGASHVRWFLIMSGVPQTDPLLDPTSNRAQQFWRVLFRETAYLAAVFHDVGYPWQYVGALNTALRRLNTPGINRDVVARDTVSSFGNRLLFYPLNGYQPANPSTSDWWTRMVPLTEVLLNETHGLPGALAFLSQNDSLRTVPTTKRAIFRLLCVEWAAIGILMHDLCKAYWGDDKTGRNPDRPSLRVSFAQDPLAGLITLADQIQEFERPTADFQSPGMGGPVELSYDRACVATDIDVRGRTLVLRFQMADSGSVKLKRRYLRKDQPRYFDPQYGFVDLSVLGIDEVRMEAY